MYTAFARNTVRGADPVWTRHLFGCALMPDLVLYLEIDIDTLLPRVVQGKGMDYWESGMHLALGNDIFESFQRYQRRLIEEYNVLAREFDFVTVDARRSIDAIQGELREHVSPTSPGRAARHRPRAATRPRTIACAAAGEMTAPRVPQRVGLVLSPDDGAAVAARVVVRFHLRAFARVEPAARAGEVEPVHQLRVTTRRLRAPLRLFAPVLPARFAAAAHRDLAWLATAIGAVRDLDVLGETLRKQAARLDPELRREVGPL